MAHRATIMFDSGFPTRRRPDRVTRRGRIYNDGWHPKHGATHLGHPGLGGGESSAQARQRYEDMRLKQVRERAEAQVKARKDREVQEAAARAKDRKIRSLRSLYSALPRAYSDWVIARRGAPLEKATRHLENVINTIEELQGQTPDISEADLRPPDAACPSLADIKGYIRRSADARAAAEEEDRRFTGEDVGDWVVNKLSVPPEPMRL